MVDFDKLTEAQLNVLGAISVNQDYGHSKSTLQSLLRRGLIECRDDANPGQLPIVTRHYVMPIHIHMQWCEWCSRNCGDE